jgi:hypothetical protein
MQRPAGAVEIRTIDDAAASLARFRSYSKLLSWLVLHVAGVPALPGIIVTDWDEAIADTVDRFANQWPAQSLLLRSDAASETARSPRGGFVSHRRDLERQVVALLQQGRLAFLLEPLSPFDDLYSISLQPDPAWRQWEVEVVGPGFDASDLKRGDVTPHERLRLRTRHGEVHVTSQTISSPEAQVTAREIRMEKVAALLGCSTESVAEVLSDRGETLLVDNVAYRPIPQGLLQAALGHAARLKPELQKSDLADEGLLLSMSFVGQMARAVFWDVVWPSGKYRGTTAPFRTTEGHG